MSGYVYYQVNGGEEDWTVVQVEHADWENIRPAFITILSLDKIIQDRSDREFLESVCYSGPMYFDFDDADNVANSIEDAQKVVNKITALGVDKDSIEIYLSGSKGLHVIIPPETFMAKVQPKRFLPHIYREIAMELAEPTTDMRVYTARRGRQLRTCYRQRNNGKWRVQITHDELMALTAEQYPEYCATETRKIETKPGKFTPKFALLYDKAAQVYNTRPKKGKPVTPEQLQNHLPMIESILAGEVSDVGFNRIAIQVAVYAREAGWNEDQLIERAKPLLEKYSGDGNRYNSVTKRTRHLRDMFYYVEDNPGYEYNAAALRSIGLNKIEPGSAEEGTTLHNQGVFQEGYMYKANRGDDVSVPITNFAFRNVVKLVDPTDEQIVAFRCWMEGDNNVHRTASVLMLPASFSSSSAIQAMVAPYGASFTGSDQQARGLYQLLLRTVEKTTFIIDTEGMNLVNIPKSRNPLLRDPFVCWADADGVRLPPEKKEQGVDFTFQGFPEPEGVMRTDLTMAPSLREFWEVEQNRVNTTYMLTNLIGAYEPGIIAKTLGWMVACFWRQHFHLAYGKFPLLHTYGPAGSGKTDMLTKLSSLFFYKAPPPMITPSSTAFAFLQLVGGSASIPVILDEYKPATMDRNLTEKYRGLFRDAYNMKDTQRGGGNLKKDAFNALNRMKLSAPIAFVAEAMETETAIVERSVIVSIRHATQEIKARNSERFDRFSRHREILAVFGNNIAGRILRAKSLNAFHEDFDKVLYAAKDAHMLRDGDAERVRNGEMARAEYTRRSENRERVIYNLAVVEFGLLKFEGILKTLYGDEFETLFGASFRDMFDGIYKNPGSVALSTVPEYIKVLNVMAGMTKLHQDSQYKLQEGVEYNVFDVGGQYRLGIDMRAAFNRYRAYTRSMGAYPLYASEEAFIGAITQTPQYLTYSTELAKMRDIPVALLDYQALTVARMDPWAHKVVDSGPPSARSAP